MCKVNRNIGTDGSILAELETGSENPILELHFPQSLGQSRTDVISVLSQLSDFFQFSVEYFIREGLAVADDDSSNVYDLSSARIAITPTPAGRRLLNCIESFFSTLESAFIPVTV